MGLWSRRLLWASRLKRWGASASPILFAGIIALLGLRLSGIEKEIGINSILVWITLVVPIALLGFQIVAEYQRRTYDPSWMLKLNDQFDNKDMRNTRSTAARILKDNKTQLGSPKNFSTTEIDDVLDFFEGMAFLVRGGQISPEVAQHAFYYWIEGYHLATKKYVEAVRRGRPAQWEFIEWLYKATSQVERTRAKHQSAKAAPVNQQADDEKCVAEFLDGEIELQAQTSSLDWS